MGHGGMGWVGYKGMRCVIKEQGGEPQNKGPGMLRG